MNLGAKTTIYDCLWSQCYLSAMSRTELTHDKKRANAEVSFPFVVKGNINIGIKPPIIRFFAI